MQKKFNAFTVDHLWSPEKLKAWEEMPKSHLGWTAPATEAFRVQWKEWWAKWGKKFPYLPISEGYAEIDRRKAVAEKSTKGNV